MSGREGFTENVLFISYIIPYVYLCFLFSKNYYLAYAFCDKILSLKNFQKVINLLLHTDF